MLDLKITFSDGDVSYTRFNGTPEDAVRYYKGHVFNHGTEYDRFVSAVSLEVLKGE